MEILSQGGPIWIVSMLVIQRLDFESILVGLGFGRVYHTVFIPSTRRQTTDSDIVSWSRVVDPGFPGGPGLYFKFKVNPGLASPGLG